LSVTVLILWWHVLMRGVKISNVLMQPIADIRNVAMPADSSASFVHALRHYEIVSGTQADEIARTLLPRFADVRRLAQELVRRGHLTAFQAGQLLQGQGQNLVLGSYRLLDCLGEGGMGQVFKARHVRMDKIVAIKLIHKERLSQPQIIERFSREARAAAQLSHPNIVIAHDAGQAGEVHFLAMEYVEGVDLAKLVQQSGRLAVALACEFIRQAALGLQHAFEKGVVHRDIKPGNLLACKSGSNGAAVVKILDFGLARYESETGPGNSLTQFGKVLGTVDYIAPEQAENARQADIRSDIYSLGCSLFYLLTGQPPFPGETAIEKLSARLLGKPDSIRALRPEVPEGLAQVLGKMLARDPAQRYQTPAEVAGALEALSQPGKVKAGSRDAAAGKTTAPGAGLGQSGAVAYIPPGQAANARAAVGQNRTRPAESNPFAHLGEEDKTTFERSSQALVVAKSKPRATDRKGVVLGLGIGGTVAAILAFVLLTVLSRDGDGKEGKVLPPFQNSLGIKFVGVPAGTFWMSAGGKNAQKQVEIPNDFYLGKYPVTQAQWQAVMGNNPSWFSRSGGGAEKVKDISDADLKQFPVEQVSWKDVQEFLKKLNASEKKSGWRYRLPTEAEWEYACRGAATSKADCSFDFYFDRPTNDLSSREANFHGGFPAGNAPKGPNLGRTSTVGSYPRNELGLYDMHGNVWQWCDDDCNGVPTRVFRGASWNNDSSCCRAAARAWDAPTYRYRDVGFRLALVPSGK
jgi:formylglycine-generating enzyme required for sulfatase activity/tRNA A-37 threonylcarbamoyl transferase component Bud32